MRCSIGTLFKASQFLSEELPIRLAHRVQELQDLPDGLNEMPSIKRVQDWYAQSFEVNFFSQRSELNLLLTCDFRRLPHLADPNYRKMFAKGS